MSKQSMIENYKTIVDEVFPDLDCFINPTLLTELYDQVETYLKSIRFSSEEKFKEHLLGLKDFFDHIGYSYEDAVEVVISWPSIIHTDKNELFYKYLILGRVVNKDTLECDRDNILKNHPKDFITSPQVVYARVKWLLSIGGDAMRNNIITRRKILKVTHAEFEKSYGISKEELESLYPFEATTCIPEILNWTENKELLKRIQGKGITND